MDPPDSFLTLGGSGEVELKIQRSRFIGRAVPVTSQDEAKTALEETSRRFHDARHVCYGYRLGLKPEVISRKSDDGEPSGTGGDPILASIGKLELTDVLVMVVRYFGGIKLGTGGLARAYGQAAADALRKAPVREVLLGREFVLRFPYPQEKTIRRLVTDRDGRLVNQEYGQDVTWRIWLPHSRWRAFSDTLTEVTAGSVRLEEPAG
jgi:uncharacterized YigZ family protein